MCGIAGFSGQRLPDERERAGALEFMRARGPDERGAWADGGACLLHTRLSIIDLASGHQPMTSADGRFVLVFNGEIYNFRELRAALEREGLRFRTHSDTEVLLNLLALRGIDACLPKLRGMFAFALWDSQEETLTLARDRLGVKPLVYAETPRGFLFGSEIGALFALDPALPRDIEPQAVDHYLTFQYIPSPLTGFAAVRKLPPAHAMVVRDGRVERCWRYWQVDPLRRSPLSLPQACEAVRDKFLEATRLRLVADVPLGAFLSGGMDSSITVAAMARLQDRPVETFSIGFDDAKIDELPYARAVARHFGTNHHEFVVKPVDADIVPQLIEHFGEPIGDDSILPTFLVSREARRHVTVAVTGDGGDESFGGYRRFYQIARVERLERLGLLAPWRGLRRGTVAFERLTRNRAPGAAFPATRADQMLYLGGLARYKHLLAFFTDEEKIRLFTDDFRARLGCGNTDAMLEQRFAASAGADRLTRYLLLDQATFLPEDVLFKVDIASMQNSLECRSPFLDHEMVELAASLPAKFKLPARDKFKFILRRTFAQWLPPGFFDRPKQGFSAPVARWLRNELWPLVEGTLLQEKTLAPILHQASVERYVRGHREGTAPSGRRVWALLVLALWLRRMRVAI